MNQNVVLDFSRPDLGEQELAVMPADLAKRLLKAYAKELNLVTARELMHEHLDKLSTLANQANYPQFVKANLEFAIERQLMDNITQEKWDVYSLKPVQP